MMGDDVDKWASLAAELGLADAPPAAASEADLPKRGRSRSRRGSARKRPAEDVAAVPPEEVMEDAVITEDVTMDDEAAGGKKRRRRRSRKKKGTAGSTLTSNGDAATVVMDDDESELPTADWKMPTWQELIDSLHRP